MFFLPIALLLSAVLVLYARTLGYGYVWDDLSYAASFQRYQLLDGIVRAVTEQVFASRAYYRPLAMLSFAVAGDMAVQHGINVLLHAVNTVLVFLCARALMPHEAADSAYGRWVPALGALIFAVHPAAVEPTVWVSGRFDALMCSFVLGICLVALGGELTRRCLLLVSALFFAALCSKESAVGLPVALPFLLLHKWRLAGGSGISAKEQCVQLAQLWAALGLAVMLYAAVRLMVMQALLSGKDFVFHSDKVQDKVIVASLAVAEFAKLALNPWSHSAPLHPFAFEVGRGVLPQTIVVVVCVLGLLAATFLKKPRLNFPLALLAALAMLWPALHLIGIPNGENIISDRYALASLALLGAGLAAAAGTWLERRVPAMNAGERRALMYAGAFGLLWMGALAAHTNTTIPLWRDGVAFWTFMHRQEPDSSRAHQGYVGMLVNQERWDEADAEMKRFLDKNVKFTLSVEYITSLMLVYAKTGAYDDALAWFAFVEGDKEKFGQIAPKDLAAFYDVRGIIEGDAGSWDKSAYYFDKAMQAYPKDEYIPFRYAHALFMAGRTEQSERAFDSALAGVTKDMADWAREWRKTWAVN